MSGRVVVVGSVNVDLVVRGERLPSPGETVTGGIFERYSGGKGGNQAVAAARLGRTTLFVGAVGDDPFGGDSRSVLAGENVDVSRLATIRGEATGVALILVDRSGENCISVASGANARLEPSMVTEALRRLGSLTGDVVLVSREIPSAAVLVALRAARDAGATTVLNPAPAVGASVAELSLVDVLTPNRVELMDCLTAVGDEPAPRTALPDRHAAERLARRLIADAGIGRAVVVTMGSTGALLVPVTGPAVHVPAHRVKAVDATGAGDTFSGALAASLAAGLPIVDAVRRATVAAALSTTVPGAREGMPSLAALEAALA